MPAGGPRAHLAMLANAFLVATSFPVGAAITHALPPAALNGVRFALAATVFAVLLTLTGGWRRPGPRDGLRYVLLAAALVGFFVAMFAALRLTTAVNTSALFTLVPLMSAAIAWPLLGQRTPPRQLACMALAGLGALCVVFRGSAAAALAFQFSAGDLIFLAGCVSFAAFSPLTRRLDVGENLMSQTFWTLVAATAMLAALAAPGLAGTDWTAVPAQAWAGIAYLAVFTTAATFYLMKYASLRLPAARVMAYSYLIPGFVVLLETVRTGAPPPATVLAGAAIAALATLALQLSRPATR
jgi:drug/metabolite transporter (DMT)-like permease